jgi:hypothetical protein
MRSVKYEVMVLLLQDRGFMKKWWQRHFRRLLSGKRVEFVTLYDEDGFVVWVVRRMQIGTATCEVSVGIGYADLQKQLLRRLGNDEG